MPDKFFFIVTERKVSEEVDEIQVLPMRYKAGAKEYKFHIRNLARCFERPEKLSYVSKLFRSRKGRNEAMTRKTYSLLGGFEPLPFVN